MTIMLPNGYQNRVRIGEFVFVGIHGVRNVGFEQWAIPGHERVTNDKGDIEWVKPDHWSTEQVRQFASEKGVNPVFTVACVYAGNHKLTSDVPDIS